MSKAVIITDTHWGVRNDNIAFHDYTKKFLDDVFFPYIEKNNIKQIIHLGDITDRRKYINYYTAKRLDEDFMKRIRELKCELTITIGNHDVYWKNTNVINSMRQLYGDVDYIDIIERPKEKNIAGVDILFMPWICSDTIDESFESMKKTKSQVLMGHLEINGFEMYKGHINEHGIETSVFDKFDVVCSGHYHHKSSYGNIHYLGSHAQFTWADYNDPRGFHVFDGKTRELQFIENPYEIFNKVFYDDTDKDMTYVSEQDFSHLEKTYVKVVVKNKTNHFIFDAFLDKLEKVNLLSFQVVEDNMYIDNLEADQIIDEAEDTLTILKNYVDSVEVDIDGTLVKNFLQDLYNEALEVE